MNEPIQPTVDLGYPTEAHGRIPAFQNVEEEAAFWDTHDITDYLDELEPVKLAVSPGFGSEYRVTVGLTPQERAEAERQASEQGIGPAVLVQRLVKAQLTPKTEATAKSSR